MAFWGCLTMGQIWRSSTVTLHGPEQKLKSMWSLLCKSWDLTGLLRVESRSLFLLPRHGMIEVPLFEKGTEFGYFPVHRGKKWRKELGKIHMMSEKSPNQAFNTSSRATKEASLPRQGLL